MAHLEEYIFAKLASRLLH